MILYRLIFFQIHRWTYPCRYCPERSARLPRRRRLPRPADWTRTNASRCPANRLRPTLCPATQLRWTTTSTWSCATRLRWNRDRSAASAPCCRARCAAKLSTDRRCSRDTCAPTQVRLMVETILKYVPQCDNFITATLIYSKKFCDFVISTWYTRV